MGTFRGVVIAESLADKAVLERLRIVATRVEQVTDRHSTPWLEQWTLHTVEVPEEEANEVAQALSRAIDKEHAGSWYADFKDDRHGYVIYSDKVFYFDRRNREQIEEVKRYGIGRGLPPHQADFDVTEV